MFFKGLEFTNLAIISISKAFYAVPIDIQSNKDVTNSYIRHFSKRTISYFIFKCKFGTKCQSIAKFMKIIFFFFFFFFSEQEYICTLDLFLKK